MGVGQPNGIQKSYSFRLGMNSTLLSVLRNQQHRLPWL